MNASKSVYFLIFSTAVLIRFLFIYQIHSDPLYTTLTFDSKLYDQQAHDLLDHGPLYGDVYILGPLYSFFLAAIHIPFSHNILAMMVAQAILGAISCAMIARMGELLFGLRVGVLAGLMSGAYGPLVYYPTVILTEPVLVFVNTLFAYLLIIAYKEGGTRNWTLAGLALGLSALGKSNILAAAPVILAICWLYPAKKKGRNAVVWLIVGCLLIVAPITIRNLLLGGYAPITGNFGVNLFTGNNPKATGTFMPLNELLPSSGNAYHIPDAQAMDSVRPLSEADSTLRDKAILYITSDPAGWMALMFRKAMLYLNSYEIPDMEDYEFHKNEGILRFLIPSMALITPLGLLGMMMNRKSRATWPLTAYLITYGATFILFFIKARFRIMLMPVVILFAADAIWMLADIWKRNRATLLKPAIAIILLIIIVNNPAYRARIEGTGMYNPYNNIGKELANTGQNEKAIQYYLKAIEYSPGHYESYNNLGEAYNRLRDYPKAENALRKAIELDPTAPTAHSSLGTALYMTGRPQDAIKEYELALEANPYYYEARSNLATAYLDMGEVDKAITEYEAALRINPKDETIKENLAGAYALKGSNAK